MSAVLLSSFKEEKRRGNTKWTATAIETKPMEVQGRILPVRLFTHLIANVPRNKALDWLALCSSEPFH